MQQNTYRIRTLEQLCKHGAKSGYVLETGEVIECKTIAKALKVTATNIDHRMKEIEDCRGRLINQFYIGKSHVRERKTCTRFDPQNSSTWRLDNGVNARYQTHREESYGRDGLIVVAVVTKNSIPEDCKKMKYITHQEEYALTLEKRLIQKYKYERKDKRLGNKGTAPGRTDQTESIGCLIYITFTLDGKCVDTI